MANVKMMSIWIACHLVSTLDLAEHFELTIFVNHLISVDQGKVHCMCSISNMLLPLNGQTKSANLVIQCTTNVFPYCIGVKMSQLPIRRPGRSVHISEPSHRNKCSGKVNSNDSFSDGLLCRSFSLAIGSVSVTRRRERECVFKCRAVLHSIF